MLPPSLHPCCYSIDRPAVHVTSSSAHIPFSRPFLLCLTLCERVCFFLIILCTRSHNSVTIINLYLYTLTFGALFIPRSYLTNKQFERENWLQQTELHQTKSLLMEVRFMHDVEWLAVPVFLLNYWHYIFIVLSSINFALPSGTTVFGINGFPRR